MVVALFDPFVAREVEIGANLPLNLLLERIARLDPDRFAVSLDRAQVEIVQRSGGPRLKLEGRAAATPHGSVLEGRLFQPSHLAPVPAALGLLGIAASGFAACAAAGWAPTPEVFAALVAAPERLWPAIAGVAGGSVLLYLGCVVLSLRARARFSNAVADAILPADDLA
jgi:hypothetical protein